MKRINNHRFPTCQGDMPLSYWHFIPNMLQSSKKWWNAKRCGWETKRMSVEGLLDNTSESQAYSDCPLGRNLRCEGGDGCRDICADAYVEILSTIPTWQLSRLGLCLLPVRD
jgi:hypothetical protein